jgi:hypothetical protein
VERRLILELIDERGWPAGVDMMKAGALAQLARPDLLGFGQEWKGNTLRLWPETPEATLRFTAWLAEGQRLRLEHGYKSNRDRRCLVVRLRDFDGDEAELPVVTGNKHAEPWLVKFPTLAMHLSNDDRLGIARWAYPLNDWMNSDLVEKLI